MEPHTLACGSLLVQWHGGTWAAMHMGLDKPLTPAALQQLCSSDAIQLLPSQAHPLSSGTAFESAASLSCCC